MPTDVQTRRSCAIDRSPDFFFNFFGLLHLQNLYGQFPQLSHRNRTDHPLDSRISSKAYRQRCEYEAQKYSRRRRIGSHLATHGDGFPCGLEQCVDLMEATQDRRMERVVEMHDRLIRSVDYEIVLDQIIRSETEE